MIDLIVQLPIGDTSKARIFFSDGTRSDYNDAALALSIYYELPQGCRAAFRAVGDSTPVYPHDYVDCP